MACELQRVLSDSYILYQQRMEKTAGRKRSDWKTKLELKGKRAVSGESTSSYTCKAIKS